MKITLLIVLLAGCTTRQVFVRSILVEDRWIVVEKCPLEYSANEVRRADSECTTDRLAIPVPTTEAAPK